MSKAIAYTDQGSGPVVVLLHGFCESKAVWADFSRALSAGYRVICPDLPGFGESLPDRKQVSMEWFAGELHTFFQMLNIHAYHFVGHSLGGYVGLALAEKYPQELKSFCLFHSTAYADSDEKKINRDRAYKFVEKHGVETFAQSFIDPLFLLKNRQRLRADIDRLKQIAAHTSLDGLLATTLAMRDRPDRTQVLASLECPVLLIGGRNDATVRFETLEEQSKLSAHIALKIAEDCGHMGMFEQKALTLGWLREFLKKGTEY